MPQRAEAEQRAGGPPAAQLERILEQCVAPPRRSRVTTRSPRARSPVAASARRRASAAPSDCLPDVGVLVVDPRRGRPAWSPVRDSTSSRLDLGCGPAPRAGCPHRRVSPDDSSSSTANSRMVSSIQNRGSPSESARWRRRLFSTSESRPSRRSGPSDPSGSQTASAASRRQPPTNTPSRAKSSFSPFEQEVVAPLDRAAERPLALVEVLRAAGQQLRAAGRGVAAAPGA